VSWAWSKRKIPFDPLPALMVICIAGATFFNVWTAMTYLLPGTVRMISKTAPLCTKGPIQCFIGDVLANVNPRASGALPWMLDAVLCRALTAAFCIIEYRDRSLGIKMAIASIILGSDFALPLAVMQMRKQTQTTPLGPAKFDRSRLFYLALTALGGALWMFSAFNLTEPVAFNVDGVVTQSNGNDIGIRLKNEMIITWLALVAIPILDIAFQRRYSFGSTVGVVVAAVIAYWLTFVIVCHGIGIWLIFREFNNQAMLLPENLPAAPAPAGGKGGRAD